MCNLVHTYVLQGDTYIKELSNHQTMVGLCTYINKFMLNVSINYMAI